MKKKMKPETKENLKNIFGSLISNQRAIDGARHNRWWVALIMFVISIALPVIPVTVYNANLSGSSFFSQGMRSFDNTITSFTMEMYEKEISLEINDHHYMEDTEDKWLTNYTYDLTGVQYAYVNSNTDQYDLLVYFTKETGSDFTASVKDVIARQYIIGSQTKYVQSESSESTAPSLYSPTVIILGTERLAAYVFNPNTTTAYGNVTGDYLHTAVGTKISHFALEESIIPVDVEDDINLANTAYVKAVTQNWTNLFNESFLTLRDQNTLFSSLLSLGIYAVLGVFMGLMVFLLTRGKKNIFHVFTFGDCEKISSWAMVSPAILSLILGFILQQYAVMFFIILLGVRVMWLSMRQLKPTGR